jgi:hypothetical protein
MMTHTILHNDRICPRSSPTNQNSPSDCQKLLLKTLLAVAWYEADRIKQVDDESINFCFLRLIDPSEQEFLSSVRIIFDMISIK